MVLLIPVRLVLEMSPLPLSVLSTVARLRQCAFLCTLVPIAGLTRGRPLQKGAVVAVERYRTYLPL